MVSLVFALLKVNAFGILLFIGVVFILFSKERLVKPIKRLQEKTIKILEIAVRGIIAGGLILLMIGVTLPVIRDDIWILKKGLSWNNLLVKEGKVVMRDTPVGGFWFLYQDLHFEGDDSEYPVYFTSIPVIEDHTYRIYYLPYSKSVVKVIRMNGDEDR